MLSRRRKKHLENEFEKKEDKNKCKLKRRRWLHSERGLNS